MVSKQVKYATILAKWREGYIHICLYVHKIYLWKDMYEN